MLLGLRVAIYNPGDLDKGKAWYGDVLGLKPNFDQPFYADFVVKGYDLGLSTGISKASADSGVLVYWGVNDIHQAHARLIELGATAREAVEDVGDGILVASVVDPFGNIVGIIQNPHFKAAG